MVTRRPRACAPSSRSQGIDVEELGLGTSGRPDSSYVASQWLAAAVPGGFSSSSFNFVSAVALNAFHVTDVLIINA